MDLKLETPGAAVVRARDGRSVKFVHTPTGFAGPELR
jgi:hypothetical protein